MDPPKALEEKRDNLFHVKAEDPQLYRSACPFHLKNHTNHVRFPVTLDGEG